MRVVLGVADDEAGIDAIAFTVQVDVMGVGVATDMVVRLEHGDFVFARQQPRRGQAADAGTDNRDLHRAFLSCSGTGFRSQISRHQLISLSPYQVKSYSHQ